MQISLPLFFPECTEARELTVHAPGLTFVTCHLPVTSVVSLPAACMVLWAGDSLPVIAAVR